MAKTTDKLSYKHRAFVDNLFKRKFNQTRAYQDTYNCSYDTAKANGADLLTKTNVKIEIESTLKEKKITDTVTIDFILQGLVNIALTAKKEETRKSAYDSLARYKAMFTDKVIQEGHPPPAIIDNIINIDKTSDSNRL